MTVEAWAAVFFAELSKRLGKPLHPRQVAEGAIDIDDPFLRVLGCEDDFMSVWLDGEGLVWDDEPTAACAVSAAEEVTLRVRPA